METYRDFVDQILRPTNFKMLKPPEPYEKIVVRIFSSPDDEPEEIEIDQLYPFHTIEDLQTIIYIAKDKDDTFHPYNQCLLLPIDESNTPYLHFQYVYNDSAITLANPFTLLAGKPDTRFVDLNGTSKNLKTVYRGAVTLQSALFHRGEETYTVDLFLYTDILSRFAGERPISRIDWEGKFRVYFPTRAKEDENGQIPEKLLADMPLRVERFENKLDLIEKTDLFVQEGDLRIPGEKGRGDPVNLTNFRNLRFAWPRPSFRPGYEPIRIDSIFYDIPVSKIVPYIRFFPKAGVPLSKVFVDGPLNIPAMDHPEVLLQWSQESSLTPQEDIIMIKFLVRAASGSSNPLYGTLFIFEDGSAKMIIQPNADTKSIARVELADLHDTITNLMNTIPKIKPKLQAGQLPPRDMYSPRGVMLEDAYIVFSLWLDREESSITAKSLMKVLPYLRPFFQVTSSPIQEQNPLSFLRYKGVDNFRTPARDFQFLMRVLDLQKLAGRTDLKALVPWYIQEFEVDRETAERRVSQFLKNELEFSLVNPQILEFNQTENPGIDIAIFGKQNQYTFHLYRIDSLYNLKMLKTLLSVLVSVEPSFYIGEEESAEVVEEEEEEETAHAEQKAAVEKLSSREEQVPPAVAAAAAAAAPNSSDEALEFDGLGLEAFGSNSEEEVAFQVEAAAAPAKPKSSLQELAEQDSPEVQAQPQEVTGKGKAKKGKKEDEEDVLIVDPAQLKTLPARTYFLSRLKFYDRKLFKFEVAPGELNYGRKCSAAALRQPIVISEDEYQRMREEYEKDEKEGDIIWVDYPLPKKYVPPVSKKQKYEKITTLRYGTNLLPGQANIYICSQFWCRRDEIVVLKKDFEATVDRTGKPKEKNTCPFCRGKLVITKEKVVPGETVLSRSGKDTHTDIGFMKTTNHPGGFRLPCCFLKDKPLLDTSPEFSGAKLQAPVKVASKETPKETLDLNPEVEAEAEAEVEADAEEESSEKKISVNYTKALSSLPTAYIIGAEKLPLVLTSKGPQIGVLPPLLDKYFGQNSSTLVKQDHTVWRLMTDNKLQEPNVSGFFRIGVENSKQFQPESFLSAIAPYYGLNSAEDMKRVLKQIIQPPVFLSLNYGNFLFDFYNPTKPTPPNLILKGFAHRKLLLASGVGAQQEAVARVWKAFTAFEETIDDQTKYKEYRQYAPLLAQPLLVSSAAESLVDQGILFIVLEVRGSEITVRCPPYGVSQEMARRCDIAFISHYPELGIWEPIFYTQNEAGRIRNKYSLVFRQEDKANWPAVVKRRVDEFIQSCESSGMGLYTDSPNINPKSLIPLSDAMNFSGVAVYGILRDTYNHVSGVIYELNEKFIIVPVIDDGILYPGVRVELDWRNIVLKLAPVSLVRLFYTTKLGPLLRKFPKFVQAGYIIDKLIRLDKTIADPDLEIYAFHLTNGLFVPAQKASVPIPGVEVVKESEYSIGQEIPWFIDSKLVYGKLDPFVSAEIDHKEFNEIYQHLRLTFSNWLALSPPALKKEIDSILFKDGEPNIDLPLYEKRQRLFIKFGNEVLSWLDSSIPQRDRVQSVKRVDCHIIRTEKDCTNKCVWKGDSSRCLLHVPEVYEVGEKKVDAKELLLKKLIDELIRFPEKRDELLKEKVSQYQILRDGFRSGNQYIVPENLPAWTELLRMEWKKVQRDIPRHAEEFIFSSKQLEREVLPPPAASAPQAAPPPAESVASVKGEIPKQVKNFLLDKGKGLYFLPEETRSIWPILVETLDFDVDTFESEIDVEIPVILEQKTINDLVKTLKFSILQIIFTPGSDSDYTTLAAKGVYPNAQKADLLVFIQLPDQSIGVISRDPKRLEPLPFSSLSAPTRLLLHRAPTVELAAD